jgi:hypothetical protein
MELISHPATQSIIHHLMLLDASLTSKGCCFNKARVMVSITAKIFYFNLRIWKGSTD